MSATPELPSVEPSKAAEMLERVRSEAAELRNFTITFLSLLLYVAIIIASTTHEQILRIDPVKLPLLNVDIPIVGFYWFMPALLFFIHLYILLQHYLFSQLAFRFREELLKTDDKTQHQLQRSLGNLPFLHWLAGRQNRFMTFLMSAITVVSLIVWPLFTFWWLQAAFLPYHDNDIVWTQRIFLLLDTCLVAYLWAKILDDRDDAGLWWRPWLAPFSFSWWGLRIKAFLKCLGQMLTVPERWRRPSFPPWFNRFNEWLEYTPTEAADSPASTTTGAATTRWVLSGCLTTALFFSFAVSTIPDSPEEAKVVKALTFIEDWIDPLKHSLVEELAEIDLFSGINRNRRSVFTLTNWLHEQKRVEIKEDRINDYDSNRIRECDDGKNNDKQSKDIDPKNQAKCYLVDGLFPRNLILTERILIANKDLPPEILAKLDAKVEKTDPEALAKAKGLDLRGRHLEYADFSQSSLPNADLRRAHMHRINLKRAQLNQARLEFSELQEAELSFAKLPGADLSMAKLSFARLFKAKLPKAKLLRSELHRANLSLAQFQGADLSWAQLSDARLANADLTEAVLFQANLNGAFSRNAVFDGASLFNSELIGSDLSGTQFSGADLSQAKLNKVNLYSAKFSGTKLIKTELFGSDLSKAEFSGADLTDAILSGVKLSKTLFTGVILIDTEFSPMNKTQGAILADKLENTLKGLFNYQGQQGREKLEKEIADFLRRTTSLVDLSNISFSGGCLLNLDSKLSDVVPCKQLGSLTNDQMVKKTWLSLSCQDLTENRWIIKSIYERVELLFSFGFSDYASMLVAQLKTPDQCPGLAGLDKEWKKKLQGLAKKAAEQSKKH